MHQQNNQSNKTQTFFCQSLEEAFASAGLPHPNVHLQAGKFVRFSTNGKPDDDAGYCMLFADGDGASFGDHRANTQYIWQRRDAKSKPLNESNRKAYQAKATAAREEADFDKQIRHEQAARTAHNIWIHTADADVAHPYITRKDITPHVARQSDRGDLVLPVMSPDGDLQSLQFISEDGSKKFLGGGRVKSGRMILGDLECDGPIILCEGWATGCSLHDATGHATVVCFSGANIKVVAADMHSRVPNKRLIIAGDLDESGVGAGYAADAQAVAGNAVVVFPTFTDERASGDFNDLHQSEGLDSVAEQVETGRYTPVVPINSVAISTFTPVLAFPTNGRDVRDGTANTRPLTELGNAYRIYDLVGTNLRYVYDRQKWLKWTDDAWTWEPDGAWVRMLAAGLPTAIYAEGTKYPEDSNHFAMWSRMSQKAKTVKESVSMLQDFSDIRLSATQIDANDMIVGINLARQVVDLRSGLARSTTREDYVAKSLNVAELGVADKAVRWKQFLSEVFDNDVELIDWLQRFCGYLLTASTEEHIFLFLHGKGKNGKSVFVETLQYIMGDYSKVIAAESLCATNRSGGAATPDLVPLIGARMVMSPETESNSKFAASRIKGLVAGDSMTVRENYGSPIQFIPVLKLIVTGNHMPDFPGGDEGMERRVKVVPFTKKFLDENCDPRLREKLKVEASHILAWMVQGCLEWNRRGLSDTPQAIRQATTTYCDDQDVLAHWLDECTAKSTDDLYTQALYDNYFAWCKDNGQRPISARKLASSLRERGFETRKSNNKYLWVGLRLTDFRHNAYGYGPVVAPTFSPVPSAGTPNTPTMFN